VGPRPSRECVLPARLGGRLEAQLGLQGLDAQLILPQRGAALAAVSQQAHQLAVGLLAPGFQLYLALDLVARGLQLAAPLVIACERVERLDRLAVKALLLDGQPAVESLPGLDGNAVEKIAAIEGDGLPAPPRAVRAQLRTLAGLIVGVAPAGGGESLNWRASTLSTTAGSAARCSDPPGRAARGRRPSSWRSGQRLAEIMAPGGRVQLGPQQGAERFAAVGTGLEGQISQQRACRFEARHEAAVLLQFERPQHPQLQTCSIWLMIMYLTATGVNSRHSRTARADAQPVAALGGGARRGARRGARVGRAVARDRRSQ
jgi:hypothetical protein